MSNCSWKPSSSSPVDWPLPLAPGPAGNPRGECHSLGCNVHSSHTLLWNQAQSEVAECHPENRKINWNQFTLFIQEYISTQLIREITILNWILLQMAMKGDERWWKKIARTWKDKAAQTYCQDCHVLSCPHSLTYWVQWQKWNSKTADVVSKVPYTYSLAV